MPSIDQRHDPGEAGFELGQVIYQVIDSAPDCLVRRVDPIVDGQWPAVPGRPGLGQAQGMGH